MKFNLARSLRVRYSLIFIVLAPFSDSAYTRGQYLDQWETIYPQSSSSDSGCQLCHQSPSGGDGWNQYGSAIRPIFLDIRASNGGDDLAALALALSEVEANLNQDFELAGGPTFLDEIRYNTQPGWIDTAVNTITFRDSSFIVDQVPPSYPLTAQTENDLLVTVAENPATNPLALDVTPVELQEVANGFNAPVKAVRAPGIDGSLFVVEQRGKIIRVDLSNGQKTIFHDVSEQLVLPRLGFDERGLLSVAFHPNFASNGLFYTYQSEPVRAEQSADFTTLPNLSLVEHRSMVVEYKTSDSSCNSSIVRQKTLIVVDQPQFNHNGGDLAFGPDGYLYVSFGDGGGADDQSLDSDPSLEIGHGLLGNGRNNTNPLGSILRIDVDGSNSGNGRYGIPSDNPFTAASDAGLDEIYAYGFRNPYRFSFDSLCFQIGQNCNTLFTADVGQNKLEEIDSVIKGGNYGWNWKEGRQFLFYRLK